MADLPAEGDVIGGEALQANSGLSTGDRTEAPTAYQSRNFWFVGPQVTIGLQAASFSKALELKGVLK